MKNSTLIPYLIGGLLLVLPACKKRPTVHRPVKQQFWVDECYLAVPTKRILILSSSGGGGHTAASQAIQEYLRGRYQVEIVNIFEEVLIPLDPVHALTGGSYSGEALYNYFLKTNSRFLANNMIAFGKMTTKWQSVQIQELLEEFFIHHKPDAIISVIPVLNGNVLAVAEKMNIPFAVIALDRDMASIGFLNGLWKPTYEKFIFGIPFHDEALKQSVMKKTGIPETQIRTIGVPVRSTFLEKKNIPALRKEFNIPQDKPVIMVLMGSVGSGATLRYARALSRMKQPAHLLLCLGKNEKLREQIEQEVAFPPHITTSIIGFTNRIADYMAVSNLLITKSGSVTLFEALVSQVPLLFDRTREVLAWEYSNIQFVKEHGLGNQVCVIKQVPKMVDAYVQDLEKEQKIRENIAQYQLPQVKQNVLTLVHDMLIMHEGSDSAQDCLK